MSRRSINAICKKLPGAEVSDPWAKPDDDGPRREGGKTKDRHDAWKVGGKMFACIGAKLPGVSVKTDSIETAQMLIDAGVGAKPPYFHRSWVLLPFDADKEELKTRILQSYALVRGSLTKKAQSQLPPFDPPAN